MSVENIQRIGDAFASKLANLDHVADPIGFLSDVATALARDNAETVFLKVQTELGWTQTEAQAFADQVIEDHVLRLTDVIHAHGGTLEIAQNLAKVAAVAYGTRLAELAAGYGQGGAA